MLALYTRWVIGTSHSRTVGCYYQPSKLPWLQSDICGQWTAGVHTHTQQWPQTISLVSSWLMRHTDIASTTSLKRHRTALVGQAAKLTLMPMTHIPEISTENWHRFLEHLTCHFSGIGFHRMCSIFVSVYGNGFLVRVLGTDFWHMCHGY